jgi:hypothetical protein
MFPKKKAWLMKTARPLGKNAMEKWGLDVLTTPLIHFIHFFAAAVRRGLVGTHGFESVALDADIRFVVLLLRLRFLGLTSTAAHNASPLIVLAR